jgi:hypothetical protein
MRISLYCIVLTLLACGSGTAAPRVGANDDLSDVIADMKPAMSTDETATADSDSDSKSEPDKAGEAGAPGDLPADLGVAGKGDDEDDDKTTSKPDDGAKDDQGVDKPSTPIDDGSKDGEADGDPKPPPGECFDATLMWHEDFETGNYDRYTSHTYNANWGNDCQDNATTTETFHSPGHSQRSEITCTYPQDTVHRGYGGLQFSGDTILPAYTNKGVGLDAPNGIVWTMWMRLDSPTVFQNGKWVNFWTVEGACDYTTEVLTLGLEDASDRLSAAHFQAEGGGTRTFSPNAPKLPRGQWVRVTVYVNYHTGVMHVWQDGVSLEHVTFHRAVKTICQMHQGLYASSNNDDIVLFEDDKSLWKLNAEWSDWDREPYFGEEIAACDAQ